MAPQRAYKPHYTAEEYLVLEETSTVMTRTHPRRNLRHGRRYGGSCQC